MSVLQTVEDKSYVMSVACNDCGRYFAKIKNILLFPLVILSSFLVVINGYDGKNLGSRSSAIMKAEMSFFLISFHEMMVCPYLSNNLLFSIQRTSLFRIRHLVMKLSNESK